MHDVLKRAVSLKACKKAEANYFKPWKQLPGAFPQENCRKFPQENCCCRPSSSALDTDKFGPPKHPQDAQTDEPPDERKPQIVRICWHIQQHELRIPISPHRAAKIVRPHDFAIKIGKPRYPAAQHSSKNPKVRGKPCSTIDDSPSFHNVKLFHICDAKFAKFPPIVTHTTLVTHQVP